MLIVVLAAGALAVGIHPVMAGAAVLAATRPWLFLAACAGWAGYAWFERRRGMPSPDDEARLLRSLAAELRSGASLRPALAEAAHAAPALDLSGPTRLAVAGMPMDLVADGAVIPYPLSDPALCLQFDSMRPQRERDLKGVLFTDPAFCCNRVFPSRDGNPELIIHSEHCRRFVAVQ